MNHAKSLKKRMYNVKEAAQFLGVGRRKLETLHQNGEIPAVDYSEPSKRKFLRFDVHDLNQFIEAKKKRAAKLLEEKEEQQTALRRRRNVARPPDRL